MRRLSIALLALLAACGSDAPETSNTPDTTDRAAPSAPREVRIVAPTEGAEVMGPDVTVELEVTGIEIVPAGDTASGTGHHHLYLDADLAPMNEPIPSVPGQIIHMGDGSSAYTLEGLEPGEHRVIAVVGDGVHVPVQPPMVDTVRFVVR
jgi:hypothetical protein